ncbi:hypothetical protein OTB20_12675 [Streptomyces sp. H27-H1]|uniref:ParB N-terminal domain-containing protein n=1 Tax=Streptomyces sp. H27-H1 TaxID=2996461 RepID=UPI002271C9E0|nr:ParB N-terminal domain-containing protein [Streptomyces sp. H27-H1]MCY0927040.1 hypothetical protein [Streptomyces sp. H27-H1]
MATAPARRPGPAPDRKPPRAHTGFGRAARSVAPYALTPTSHPKETTLKIHPIAAIFPMFPEDELHDLAESIRTEGQIKEILLDRNGVLLDGRNRLAACTLAGVEPRFTRYEGDSPHALILSANLYRRQISKGQ